MAQDTHFDNCPECGILFEVVSPDHDRKVKRVLAITRKWHNGPGMHSTWIDTETACNCGNKLRIKWYF